MSWVRGELIIENTLKKSIDKAKNIIRMDVRSLADLEEFPNMGDYIMPIKIITNNVFDSVEDARDYCYDNYAKWGRNYNVMVAFRDRLSAKETKKIKDLKNRIDLEEKKKIKYVNDHTVSTFKSKFIGCHNCGSKVNKEYIKNDRCPICHSDLRSKTTKQTIKRYENNIKNLKKKIDDEVKKQSKSFPDKYLIVYEEYVG